MWKKKSHSKLWVIEYTISYLTCCVILNWRAMCSRTFVCNFNTPKQVIDLWPHKNISINNIDSTAGLCFCCRSLIFVFLWCFSFRCSKHCADDIFFCDSLDFSSIARLGCDEAGQCTDYIITYQIYSAVNQ